MYCARRFRDLSSIPANQRQSSYGILIAKGTEAIEATSVSALRFVGWEVIQGTDMAVVDTAIQKNLMLPTKSRICVENIFKEPQLQYGK